MLDMRNQKMYEAHDRMIALIRDNYNVLQSLGSFGINLGFGDKTVEEVCNEHKVDTYTFLAIVNFTINGDHYIDDIRRISVPTLLQYLRASHEYFLGFQLPTIREGLQDALNKENSLDNLILKLYDEYAHAITSHMKYEEKMVFPYVEALLRGENPTNYNIDTYSKHHGQESEKLRELKIIIIRYLPNDDLHNNRLVSMLYDIYNNEDWLRLHAEVEENFFMPAIMEMERRSRQETVAAKLNNMITASPDSAENLSDREKEVIVALVQGMSNKQIADHLKISANTVMTHRRNIASKLQIHSAAGLTIYAIVNNLIDIDKVSK